ncbi:hypothetical protein [Anabaena sp. UHCC 0399]|uniref:hypothetical protein n=1 Tax=Anabaena sp. UHCC 0399 TaxID=3110238 RepID=UPI002B1EC3CB|nr:hypothetical protein [Anabaena sp. UHCC 0399]MEA5567665.1 hypothetical protein [Anabaena sp. UHCC 0399]
MPDSSTKQIFEAIAYGGQNAISTRQRLLHSFGDGLRPTVGNRSMLCYIKRSRYEFR